MRSGMARVRRITQFYLVLPATHMLIHEWNKPSCFYSVSINQMAQPEWGSAHLIIAHCLFIDLERMKGWIGLVGWPCSGQFTHTDLHCLRVLERITYKLCALTFRCLNGLALQYLSELLQPVADLESRQRLRSSSTSQLVVPCMRQSTIGDRAFTVAAPRASAWLTAPTVIIGTIQETSENHLFKISFAQQDS